MKATFTITIIRQGQYKSLSNMPLEKTVRKCKLLKLRELSKLKQKLKLVIAVTVIPVKLSSDSEMQNTFLKRTQLSEQIAGKLSFVWSNKIF